MTVRRQNVVNVCLKKKIKKSCNTLNSRILSVWHSHCKQDVLEPNNGWQCQPDTAHNGHGGASFARALLVPSTRGRKSQSSGFKWERITDLYKYANYFNTFDKRRWSTYSGSNWMLLGQSEMQIQLWDSDKSSLKIILRNAAQSIDHALPLIALMWCFSPGFIPNGPEIAPACRALCLWTHFCL